MKPREHRCPSSAPHLAYLFGSPLLRPARGADGTRKLRLSTLLLVLAGVLAEWIGGASGQGVKGNDPLCRDPVVETRDDLLARGSYTWDEMHELLALPSTPVGIEWAMRLPATGSDVGDNDGSENNAEVTWTPRIVSAVALQSGEEGDASLGSGGGGFVLAAGVAKQGPSTGFEDDAGVSQASGAAEREAAFVYKLDAQGGVVWQTLLQTTDGAATGATAIVVEEEVGAVGGDDVFVAGFTHGPLGGNLQGGAAGSMDAFVAKLSGTNGSVIWTHQFGTASLDQVTSLGFVAAAASGEEGNGQEWDNTTSNSSSNATSSSGRAIVVAVGEVGEALPGWNGASADELSCSVRVWSSVIGGQVGTTTTESCGAYGSCIKELRKSSLTDAEAVTHGCDLTGLCTTVINSPCVLPPDRVVTATYKDHSDDNLPSGGTLSRDDVTVSIMCSTSDFSGEHLAPESFPSDLPKCLFLGETDAFAAGFDAITGERIWFQPSGSLGIDRATSVVVGIPAVIMDGGSDYDDNETGYHQGTSKAVIVAGTTVDKMDEYSGALEGIGSGDFFIEILDATTGQRLVERLVLGTAAAYDATTSLVIGADGSLFVAGTTPAAVEDCDVADSLIVRTRHYGSEVSWSISRVLDGSTVCSVPMGTYDSYETHVHECCLRPGDYYIDCADSYGDGWHGASIDVVKRETPLMNSTVVVEGICAGFNDSSTAKQAFTIPRDSEATITASSLFEVRSNALESEDDDDESHEDDEAPEITATDCIVGVVSVAAVPDFHLGAPAGFTPSWTIIRPSNAQTLCSGSLLQSEAYSQACCLPSGDYTVVCHGGDWDASGWRLHVAGIGEQIDEYTTGLCSADGADARVVADDTVVPLELVAYASFHTTGSAAIDPEEGFDIVDDPYSSCVVTSVFMRVATDPIAPSVNWNLTRVSDGTALCVADVGHYMTSGEHVHSCCLSAGEYVLHCMDHTGSGWEGGGLDIGWGADGALLKAACNKNIGDQWWDFYSSIQLIVPEEGYTDDRSGFSLLDASVTQDPIEIPLGCVTTSVSLTTRYYAEEIGWIITDLSYVDLYGNDNFQYYEDFEIHVHSVCLQPGFYMIFCADEFMDGWGGGHLDVGGIDGYGDVYTPAVADVCLNFTSGSLRLEMIYITPDGMIEHFDEEFNDKNNGWKSVSPDKIWDRMALPEDLPSIVEVSSIAKAGIYDDDICEVQHVTSRGRKGCNDPYACGDPSFCAFCSYSDLNGKCFVNIGSCNTVNTFPNYQLANGTSPELVCLDVDAARILWNETLAHYEVQPAHESTAKEDDQSDVRLLGSAAFVTRVNGSSGVEEWTLRLSSSSRLSSFEDNVLAALDPASFFPFSRAESLALIDNGDSTDDGVEGELLVVGTVDSEVGRGPDVLAFRVSTDGDLTSVHRLGSRFDDDGLSGAFVRSPDGGTLGVVGGLVRGPVHESIVCATDLPSLVCPTGYFCNHAVGATGFCQACPAGNITADSCASATHTTSLAISPASGELDCLIRCSSSQGTQSNVQDSNNDDMFFVGPYDYGRTQPQGFIAVLNLSHVPTVADFADNYETEGGNDDALVCRFANPLSLDSLSDQTPKEHSTAVDCNEEAYISRMLFWDGKFATTTGGGVHNTTFVTNGHIDFDCNATAEDGRTGIDCYSNGHPLVEPSPSTAANEALHLLMLALAVNASGPAALAYRWLGVDTPSQGRNMSLAILRAKIDELEAYSVNYPGMGSLLPSTFKGTDMQGTGYDLNSSQPTAVISAVDNAELAWATLAVARAVDNAGSESLGSRYRAYFDVMCHSMLTAFYDPARAADGASTGLVSGRIVLNTTHEFGIASNLGNATAPIENVAVNLSYPHDGAEVVLHLLELYGNMPTQAADVAWGVIANTSMRTQLVHVGIPWTSATIAAAADAEAAAQAAAESAAAAAVAEAVATAEAAANGSNASNANDTINATNTTNVDISLPELYYVAPPDPVQSISVLAGNVFSAHELRRFLQLPYLDSDVARRVLKNGERARTWHTVVQGLVGFESAAFSSLDKFDHTRGIPSLGLEATSGGNGDSNTNDTDTTDAQGALVAPYAAFPLILVNRSEGLAWHMHMLSQPRMQTRLGSAETLLVDTGNDMTFVGAGLPKVTWPGKVLADLAVLGGGGPLVADQLHRDGLHQHFLSRIDAVLETAFRPQPNVTVDELATSLEGEALPFARPVDTKHVEPSTNDDRTTYEDCSETYEDRVQATIEAELTAGPPKFYHFDPVKAGMAVGGTWTEDFCSACDLSVVTNNGTISNSSIVSLLETTGFADPTACLSTVAAACSWARLPTNICDNTRACISGAINEGSDEVNLSYVNTSAKTGAAAGCLVDEDMASYVLSTCGMAYEGGVSDSTESTTSIFAAASLESCTSHEDCTERAATAGLCDGSLVDCAGLTHCGDGAVCSFSSREPCRRRELMNLFRDQPNGDVAEACDSWLSCVAWADEAAGECDALACACMLLVPFEAAYNGLGCDLSATVIINEAGTVVAAGNESAPIPSAMPPRSVFQAHWDRCASATASPSMTPSPSSLLHDITLALVFDQEPTESDITGIIKALSHALGLPESAFKVNVRRAKSFIANVFVSTLDPDAVELVVSNTTTLNEMFAANGVAAAVSSTSVSIVQASFSSSISSSPSTTPTLQLPSVSPSNIPTPCMTPSISRSISISPSITPSPSYVPACYKNDECIPVLHRTLVDPAVYDLNVAPYLFTGVVDVSLHVSFGSVQQLDTSKGRLDLQVIVELRWRDSRLQWNAFDYRGIDEVSLDPALIWNPDVRLLHQTRRSQSLGEGNGGVVVDSLGNVCQTHVAVLPVDCDFKDVYYFPWDFPTCLVEFGSWVYDNDVINLSFQDSGWGEFAIPYTDVVYANRDWAQFLLPESQDRAQPPWSQEFDLMRVEAAQRTYSGVHHKDDWTALQYKVIVTRENYWYNATVLGAMVMFAWMAIIISFMSPESHERIVGSLVLMSCQVTAQITIPFDKIDLSSKYTIYQFVTSTTIIFSFVNLIVTFIAVRLWWLAEVVQHLEKFEPLGQIQTETNSADASQPKRASRDANELDANTLGTASLPPPGVPKKKQWRIQRYMTRVKKRWQDAWRDFKETVWELYQVLIQKEDDKNSRLALKTQMFELKEARRAAREEAEEMRKEKLKSAGIEESDSDMSEDESLNEALERKILQAAIEHIEFQLQMAEWKLDHKQYRNRYIAFRMDEIARVGLFFGAFVSFWTVFGQIDQHLIHEPRRNINFPLH